MKLLFKQKFFSWFDSYDIFDEYGNTVYRVKGQLAWGHKFKIYDANENEVGMIAQKIVTLLPKFEIYKHGAYYGSLKKELSFFKPRYNIDFNGWHIEGNFLEWDYNIVNQGGQTVATIDKEIFNLTDTYSIDVVNPADALDALMVVLAIDAEKCSRS